MYALSATDAISPAIQRTKTFLFRPFKWGTFLKLSLVAVITEGSGGNFKYSNSGGHSSSHSSSFYSPFNLTPGWIAAIVAVSLLTIVLSFILYYLITRLRFAYFHCLIHNTKEIRPGWRLYRPQAARFFWLNVLVGFFFLLLVALVALPFVAGFWRLFRDTRAGGQPDVGLMLSLILPLIPIILLIVLAAFATDVILRDFMLPHFALDNMTAGEAWAAVWARIKAEKGRFFVYALLRAILPIAATIGLFIAMIIPGLMLGAVVVLAEIGLHSAFVNATGAAAFAGIFLEVLIGVVAFGIVLFAVICLGGPLSTAVRQYALLFYGGRYQKLGDILFPPPEVSPSVPEIA